MIFYDWVSCLWAWTVESAETLSAVGALAASLATFAVVAVTWTSVRQMRRAAYAQVLLEMTERFSSDVMLQGMMALREFQQKHGDAFDKEYVRLLNERDNYVFLVLHPMRRRVTHYFHNLIMLLRAKVIDKKTLRTMVFENQVEYIFEVIEPLEKHLVGYQNIKYMFDEYRRVYPQAWNAVQARREANRSQA